MRPFVRPRLPFEAADESYHPGRGFARLPPRAKSLFSSGTVHGPLQEVLVGVRPSPRYGVVASASTRPSQAGMARASSSAARTSTA